MKKILALSPLNPDFSILLLRVVHGGLFVYHGLSKALSFGEYQNYFPDILGIGTQQSLMLVIFAELVCGAMVVLGFLTRLSVIPIFITMSIAFFVAHASDPFATKELSFLFLLLSIVVFASGSGRLSLDNLLFKKR
ncbi:MAG: DoxX family protein [Cytophagales bacterium]|nr:DoxX family protein [Cytophagales bacterium]